MSGSILSLSGKRTVYMPNFVFQDFYLCLPFQGLLRQRRGLRRDLLNTLFAVQCQSVQMLASALEIRQQLVCPTVLLF